MFLPLSLKLQSPNFSTDVLQAYAASANPSVTAITPMQKSNWHCWAQDFPNMRSNKDRTICSIQISHRTNNYKGSWAGKHHMHSRTFASYCHRKFRRRILVRSMRA